MPDPTPPFLEDEPPPWVARGLATAALIVATIGLVASVVVRVRETVTGRFMLVPARGADPLRAMYPGIITRVAVREADEVRRGDTLFLIASAEAFDRGADGESLAAALIEGPIARRDLGAQLEAVRKADISERNRLATRLRTLTTSISAKREQLAIARDLADRARRGTTSGVTSEVDLANLRMSVSRLEDEIAIAEGTLADTRAAQTRLEFDAAVRDADYRARIRRIDLETEQAGARLAAQRATGAISRTGVVVASSCDGVVLRLQARAPGAFVEKGDVLADLACQTDSLVVELDIPPSGIGRVRPGQEVRLLYDAYPYQRHGVRFAEVTWTGTSRGTTGLEDSTGFRARARPDDATIRVGGADRPLIAGMGGVARIVVERRRLIAYAFAPLIQFRESMRDRRTP